MKRMALRVLVLAGCFIPALMAAEAAQKTRPPLPKPKPVEMAAPEPEASETATETVAPAPVIPREKPDQPGRSETEPAPQPEPKPDTVPDLADAKPDPGEEFENCRKELAELGAEFSVPEMPAAEGRCKVPNPVRITAITTQVGAVDFPGQPTLNCVFAKRFTAWVSDIAAPVVKAQTGEALAAISTGPGYQCRSRNGDTTSKISEHAFGNAIDIAAFKLASKESMAVSNVAKTGNVESRWLMALRISACGYFTTVLGPGSNEAHAEHYHFDLGLHGKSGNYRICE